MSQPTLSPATLQDARSIFDFLSAHCKEAGQADILLIPGSHDLRVADHAAKCFLAGRADWLVCSGGFGKITEGKFQQTEAELFAARCLQLGVPEDRLVLEKRASNTGENFTLSKKLLEERGIHPATGLIVCKPYMAKRAWATGAKQWQQVDWMVDAAPISFEEHRDTEGGYQQLVELMVGDLQRLWVYAEQDFQVAVPVPGDVKEAWERLVQAGFDRYVIK